ncbi:NAD(P)H-hydrate dehydratase [Luteolibacter pohnpeiensis]|uniref:ADP-dependent (S)-NAD(P)H-hydrate dehydratase n=1 Tax=Luteolibacter pohnpeiensis TaxID=454153 RepID=A0A934S7K4_9BACT|nr:NAD(P)H-hydrate dehydratase [Luteolibacter pohnpeiensis]MBK1883303.1 NAD(P)H-hydrate dehydratase [Luteolibacter pohnpeiensis]
MASLSVAEMRELESQAIQKGWTEETLMDKAGQSLAIAIARQFPIPGTAIGYLGKGHNAGDTLIALKILRDQFGWQTYIRAAFPKASCAILTASKWDAYETESQDSVLATPPDLQNLPYPVFLLDGLVGIGAKGALREPLASFAAEMNELRQRRGCTTIAIDLPSGTDPDDGKISETSVIADLTLMIGATKIGLLKACAGEATGALGLVRVDPLSADQAADELELICPQSLQIAKSPRNFESHKGTSGRVGLYVGSSHFTGAAVLSATGALRGGAGLITIHAPPDAADAISKKCPPEIMVIPTEDPASILKVRYDALVLGCGLGEMNQERQQQLFKLIEKSPIPTVIDADALNAISTAGRLELLPEHHVITPHPGEFKRLAPEMSELPREQAVSQFTKKHEPVLLLKGARTLIGSKASRSIRVNSTGNPGMASGGQGDFLAGVIGALLARGEPPLDAATVAAWVCGRAAEIAVHHDHESVESLTASDIAIHLGSAFKDWRRATR